MPKVIRKYRNGIVISDKAGLIEASKILKSHPVKTKLILSFMNGSEYFVKDKKKVKIMSLEEVREAFPKYALNEKAEQLKIDLFSMGYLGRIFQPLSYKNKKKELERINKSLGRNSNA